VGGVFFRGRARRTSAGFHTSCLRLQDKIAVARHTLPQWPPTTLTSGLSTYRNYVYLTTVPGVHILSSHCGRWVPASASVAAIVAVVAAAAGAAAGGVRADVCLHGLCASAAPPPAGTPIAESSASAPLSPPRACPPLPTRSAARSGRSTAPPNQPHEHRRHSAGSVARRGGTGRREHASGAYCSG
jgi:hypothetical protein